MGGEKYWMQKEIDFEKEHGITPQEYFNTQENGELIMHKSLYPKNSKPIVIKLEVPKNIITNFNDLESQFESWMSWENNGMYVKDLATWQIDHIIPISSAKTEEEVIKLNHYTNFRPLESFENLKKSNKIL